MKKFFHFFIFSIIILQIFTQDELRWTFELITNGASTPRSNLDENLKDFTGHSWIGQNELTGVGLRQSFLVGYRDRIRYIEEKKLISEEYDAREMLVYASESNVTLMSANALLQGVFLPGTGPTIDPSIVDRAVPPVDPTTYEKEKGELDKDNCAALPGRMNLVPVHVSFSHEYFTQYENTENCNGLKSYQEKNKNRKEVKVFLEEMNKKYGKKLETLFPNKNLLKDYESAYSFFDTVHSLYYEGADEFDRIIKGLGVPEQNLLNDCYTFLLLNTIGNGIDNDKDFINYLVSPIFQKIISFIDYKIEKDIGKEKDYKGYDLPKYFIVSGTSDSCGAFISFMNKYFDTGFKYCNLSTNIHLELYAEGNDIKDESNYRIEYFYNDDFLLSIKYSEFKNKIQKFLAEKSEIEEFCQKNENGDGGANWYLVGTLIALGVAIIIIVVIVFLFRQRIKSHNNMSDNKGGSEEGSDDKNNLLGDSNRTSGNN